MVFRCFLFFLLVVFDVYCWSFGDLLLVLGGCFLGVFGIVWLLFSILLLFWGVFWMGFDRCERTSKTLRVVVFHVVLNGFLLFFVWI